AHSCYKAYAFLSAGSDVEVFLKKQLSPPKLPAASSLPVLFVVFALLIGGLYVTGLIASDASLWLLLALFPVALLSERSSAQHAGSFVAAGAVAALLVAAYVAQKTLFTGLAPQGALPGTAAALWCALLFTVLLTAYWVLRQRGDTDLGRRLYRNLYAGFYLDEWATRATLALWPAKLPQRAGGGQIRTLQPQENKL
ncbi:MAG: NADH-quinone oxidoreductase subunit L, partial [Congregibacter sp.]|nr:NADH-quinone oxidoreductase subunit L [Congregibacter sp.]